MKEVIQTSAQYGFHNRTILVLLISMAATGFGISSLELLRQPRAEDISGSMDTWVLGLLAAAYFLASSL
jgi:hypothetical protein